MLIFVVFRLHKSSVCLFVCHVLYNKRGCKIHRVWLSRAIVTHGLSITEIFQCTYAHFVSSFCREGNLLIYLRILHVLLT